MSGCRPHRRAPEKETWMTPLHSAALAPATAAATTDAPQHRGRAGQVTSDFETFLRMLTVQMQNQDPLNPMQSADFAVQLATFSGVEQQVRGNALLEQLLARSDMAEMSGWVGMAVRGPHPVVHDGGTAELTLRPAAGSTRAVLVVRNALGHQVASEAVDAAATTLQWRGLGADGLPLPAGIYDLELLSFDGDALVEASVPESLARVVEVRRGAGGIELLLDGGRTVPAASVQALRASPS